MPSSIRFTLLSALSFGAVLLAGCSTSFSPNPVDDKVGTISGHIHGGQQAVSASKVYLLQAGTTAYGGPGIAAATNNASTSLLSSTGSNTQFDGTNYYVLSQSDGSFTITGDYTCTVGDVVYLYALGGNSGSGTNSNIGLMAILGTCPSGGFAASIPTVIINEVSTVAAAYSMAGFASDATHVGNTGTTLGMTGIQNAFSTAANLENIGSGTPYATTPNGNGTVPQSEINTLANIISSCVNATDVAFANCTTLFGAATGAANATTPTDTATAAINIAHAPVTNVSTLFGLQAGVASPFLPDLSAAPNDFTISLVFTGGGMVKPTYISPRTLSVDGSGNLWNANYVTAAGNISEFSNLGVPLSGTTGFTGNGLNAPFSTAVDTSNPALILVANEAGNTLSEFTSAGAAVTGSPFTPSTALSNPVDAEFDGSGNIWVANLGGFLTEMTSGGAFTSKSATTDLSSPYGVAIGAGPTGNIWVGNSGTNTAGKYATVYTNANAFSAYSAMSYHTEGGIAIDSAGIAWVAQYEKYLTKITAPGATAVTYTPGSAQYYVPELASPMVDGGGNIWVSDFDDGCIYEVSNAGVTLSGTYGFIAIGNSGYTAGHAPTTLVAEPNSLALDGSGNVWYTMTTDATLREIVGAAVPVVTPTSYAVANSKLGTRP